MMKELDSPFRLVGVNRKVKDVSILSGMTFDVSAGERIAVLGPSGAGKTTLLRLLSVQILPDTGFIELFGSDTSYLRPGRDLSRAVGIISQQFDLVSNMSVIHNVLAGRLGEWSLFKSLYSLVSIRDPEVALNALNVMGLMGKEGLRVSQLSGGEQQRVAIARLMVQDPRIIIADEPVASLDPERSNEIMSLIEGVVVDRKKTLIATLHSLKLAHRYFDRAIGIRKGKIYFDVPTSSLTERILNELYRIDHD